VRPGLDAVVSLVLVEPLSLPAAQLDLPLPHVSGTTVVCLVGEPGLSAPLHGDSLSCRTMSSALLNGPDLADGHARPALWDLLGIHAG